MICLRDSRDGTHTFDLEATLLDGARCLALELDDAQLRLVTEATTITCTFDQLWRAVAGLDPTPGEAGRLLASCLAQQIHLMTMVQHLQDIEHLLAQTLSQTSRPLALSWLQHRLDPLIRQAMSAYDGSEAMTQAIARILGQTPETIRSWAAELGYVVAPVLTSDSAAETEASTGTATDTKRILFRWSGLRLKQLEEAMAIYQEGTVMARAVQIAKHYGWPIEKVRSKLYDLQKPSRRMPELHSAARESESSTEQEVD